MRVLVTGHRGQLGSALMRRLGDDAHGIDLPEHDITDPASVKEAFEAFQPESVIHAAALTAVDYCAENPGEALRVNAGGTRNVALACLGRALPMLYVSTNEVFDGKATTPYREYDSAQPTNPYGHSKYAGERIVREHMTHFYIARTAWLYASEGTNFVHKIVARAREGQPLRVVTDEIGSPTYAEDLADAILELIGTGRYGTYHLVNEGVCSRHEFAQESLRLAGLGHVSIEAITSDSFERASIPPPYSPLQNTLAAQAGIRLRPWQDALAEFVETAITSGALA